VSELLSEEKIEAREEGVWALGGRGPRGGTPALGEAKGGGWPRKRRRRRRRVVKFW